MTISPVQIKIDVFFEIIDHTFISDLQGGQVFVETAWIHRFYIPSKIEIADPFIYLF